MGKSNITKESSCDGKIGYDNKSDASMAAASLSGKGKIKRPMNAYRCDFCSKYHVGNSRHRKKRKGQQPDKKNNEFDQKSIKVKPGRDKGFYLVKNNNTKL